ncbi:hypothetical protein N8511_03255 [Akkermansiaceae bacterium]|nr:hypothetical protein [Akkermansiaceae bacterium]
MICAIFICLTYIMGQMSGVGIVFSQLFGIGQPAGVIIGATIVFFYAGLGGMKGITYTQVAQYCVMAFAYTIPAIFIAIVLTGNVVPQLGLIGNFTADGGVTPFLEKLNTQAAGISTYLLSTEFCSRKSSHLRISRDRLQFKMIEIVGFVPPEVGLGRTYISGHHPEPCDLNLGTGPLTGTSFDFTSIGPTIEGSYRKDPNHQEQQKRSHK